MLPTKTGGRGALRDGPLAAARSILIGIGLLRVFDLHVPPALAVALLPFVIAHSIDQLPLRVGVGTRLLTMIFLSWRGMLKWRQKLGV